MKNKWKVVSITLLALNLIVIMIIASFILQPIERENSTKRDSLKKDVAMFEITAKKDELNRVINAYIEKEGLDGPVDYDIILTDKVELYGTLPFFSRTLDMKLTFEPIALESGDLLLKQKDISIGDLHLPVSYVLKFVKEKYKLPDWVIIQPNDELVYVLLQNMKLKKDLKIKANTFDLKNDHISFSVFVPTN